MLRRIIGIPVILAVMALAGCDESPGDAATAPPPGVGVAPAVRRDVTPQAQQIFRDELIDAMRYILAKKYPPQPSV